MTNMFMKKLSTSFLLITLVITAACTKSRDAKLSEDEAEGTFAIAELDIADKSDSSFSLKTSSDTRTLTFEEVAKASNEKGLVSVDADSLQVPERLHYMFSNLEVSGQANHAYKIAFTVDNRAVTAFKVVESADELSILEKQLAVGREELRLQKQIQTSRDAAKTQNLIKQLSAAQKTRSGTLYVPLFKYDVRAYGVIERIKNGLGEETSNLRLKGTDWSRATHVQISISSDDRKMVTIDPSTKDELDRVFVADRLNNKVTTAKLLNEQLDVGLNLDPATRILTLLDADSMRVFEITQISKAKLSDTQKEILRAKSENSEITNCSAEVKNLLAPTEREGCILIQRFNVPVNYVKAELPVIDYSGARASTVQFKEATPGENSGLIRIAKNVMPEEVQSTGSMDPRKTLRVSDILNKEFFFRRTLEDVSAMGVLSGGHAGSVQLVKFALEDDRIVVKKTLGPIDFRKTTTMEDEEVLSLPVNYFKRQLKDAAGNKLSVPKFVPANKADAEYASVDWTRNSIPIIDSPLAFYSEATCFRNVNNQQVVDTDMRLTEGVLSFSYLYSVTMEADTSCVSMFSAVNDYDAAGGLNTQLVQQVRERISFKVNDGSTDKAFVPNTPFTVQNLLNYGLFTMGKLKPSENGVYGREGSQIDYPAVHDFRNGKKYLYTVGGMPENDPKRRALLKRVATEVIADWNVGLRKAFDGTPLQRDGDYLELQFAGENGVVAHLGDLDKNLIWFVDRPMDNGLLGVSQAGLNPRSGVIAADSLIVYNGNNAGQLEYFRRYYKSLKAFNDGLENYKKKALAEKDVAAAPAQKKFSKVMSQVMNDPVDKVKPNPKAALNPLMGSLAKSISNNPNDYAGSRKKFAASQSEDMFLERIFKKAIELNVGNDAEAVESLTIREMLSTYGNKLSPQQKSLLKQKAALIDMHKRMDTFFKTNPGCALRAQSELNNATYEDYLKMSEDEAFVASTKITLAHELGHSMGLTHNFMGSYDKERFAFENESSKRNYSSVMDYINDSYQSYDGLGPYDIYALRAGYTGLLEVAPSSRQTTGQRFMSIESIKQKDAPNGWTNFKGEETRKLLQPFKYCTDKDVGYTPICARFDFGTTPLEIVRNEIKSYNDQYYGSHFAGDRLAFDLRNKSATISNAFSTMFSVRHFLDEALFRIVNGYDESTLETEYFEASFEAHRFLSNVISTPNTDFAINDYRRFEKVKYQARQADGSMKETVGFLENRPQSDRVLSTGNQVSDQERYESLGNNYDKIIALQILGLQSIGYSKYARTGLSFSYIDLERASGQMNEGGHSPTTSIIGQILIDNLPGYFVADDGVMLSKNSVEVDSTLTAYAAITAVLGANSENRDADANYANLFKVGNSIGNNVPKDRLTVSPLTSAKNSQARMSFWGLDNATLAERIVTAAHEKAQYLSLGESMAPATAKILSAIAKNIKATDTNDEAGKSAAAKDLVTGKAELLKVLKAANKNGKVASREELAQSPDNSLENQVESFVTIQEALLTLGLRAKEAKTEEEKNVVRSLYQNTMVAIDAFNNRSLITISAQKAFKLAIKVAASERAKELGGQGMEQDKAYIALALGGQFGDQGFKDVEKVEANYSLILRNLNFLSQLTMMTNPEYNR